MRSSGYIGPSDEILRHWLIRNKNRADALASRPDIVPPSFLEHSLYMNKRLEPGKNFTLAEKHIKEDFFYRRNKRFDTVMFPDGETLVRSGLPLDKMFMSASGEDEKKIKSFAVDVALDEYNEYMEFIPHITDIDFLLESLFAPSTITLDDFASFASLSVISALTPPAETVHWFWESASASLLEAGARSAFRKWMAGTEWDKSRHEVPKLTPIFAKFVSSIVNELAGVDSNFLFSEDVCSFISDEDMTLFDFYIRSFPKDSRLFLSAFLKEATHPLRTSVCRNLGGGVSLYMAGSADTIMIRTGEYGRMERYIPWAVNTASLFPETAFYALSLDLWTGVQRKAFETAIKNMTGKSLIIWTSANISSVPEILLENDFITRDSYESGGFCFKSVPSEDAEDYLNKSGYKVKNLKRLTDHVNQDVKNTMYEIGFISGELEESVNRRRKDPFNGMQVNIPKEVMAVHSPYMLIPDDTIEEARYRVMKSLGYEAGKITKPSIVSDDIPEFYSWIANAIEKKSAVPKLDMDQIRKDRKDRETKNNNKNENSWEPDF